MPPELRDYVYELVACDDETVFITADSNGKRDFPDICRASRQLQEEAVPVYCKTADFRSTAYEIDFTNIMDFVQKLSTASQKALTGNKHLAIFFNVHRDLSKVDILSENDMAENNMKLWLGFRQWTGDLYGRSIEWSYVPAYIRGPPRRSIRAWRDDDIKVVTGYNLLRSWYDFPQGRLRCYEKTEFSKMLAALEKIGQPKSVGPFSNGLAGTSQSV